MESQLINDLKEAFLLTDHIASRGIRLRGEGDNRTANHCASVEHRADHWCVSVDTRRQLWHCNDCDTGGSIIDWLMFEGNKSSRDVIRELSDELQRMTGIGPAAGNAPNRSTGVRREVAAYDYTDAQGNTVFQVVRFDPKEFRQRRPDPNGGWIWNLEGVNRIPYRLPEVLQAETVAITEGEKDADNVRALGYTATCNAGGAGKWLDAYSEFLTGKNVIVIPDSDDPGKKHADGIVKSLDGKVNSLKLVQVPSPFKDISDWLESIPEQPVRGARFIDLIARTPHTLKPLPVYTMAELEAHYIEFVRSVETRTFDLSRFIPSLGRQVRRLVPGELVVVMSETGVGKTAIQQCLARAAAPLPTLFFELELPEELMFERFVQMETNQIAAAVESRYITECAGGLWRTFEGLGHILVCAESGLSTAQLESYIVRSELKTGVNPAVVFVDYIGLIAGNATSRSRYEKLSASAEDLKIIAKRTRTIIVLGTQVARPDKNRDSFEPGLYDAKDSGSIENSAGLVLGAWRPDNDTMMIKVLKNTKGISGAKVECNFNGETMQLTERAEPRRYT